MKKWLKGQESFGARDLLRTVKQCQASSFQISVSTFRDDSLVSRSARVWSS